VKLYSIYSILCVFVSYTLPSIVLLKKRKTSGSLLGIIERERK